MKRSKKKKLEQCECTNNTFKINPVYFWMDSFFAVLSRSTIVCVFMHRISHINAVEIDYMKNEARQGKPRQAKANGKKAHTR